MSVPRFIDISCWSKPIVTQMVYILWILTFVISLLISLLYNLDGSIWYTTSLYNLLVLMYIIITSSMTNCGQIKSWWETNPADRIVLKYYDNCLVSYFLSLTGGLVFLQIDLYTSPLEKDLVANWMTLPLFFGMYFILNFSSWNNSALARRLGALNLFVAELIFTILALQKQAADYRIWLYIIIPIFNWLLITILKDTIKQCHDPDYNTLKEIQVTAP